MARMAAAAAWGLGEASPRPQAMGGGEAEVLWLQVCASVSAVFILLLLHPRSALSTW